MDHQERFKIGKIAEEKLEAILKWNGIKYSRTGQENFLPKNIMSKIRHNRKPKTNFVKHFPDFATDEEFIQVKNSPNAEQYRNVTIEKASYEISKELHNEFQIKVYVVWLINNKSFIGNWIHKLSYEEPKTERESLSGSMTPMYLISKEQLIEFDVNILKAKKTF